MLVLRCYTFISIDECKHFEKHFAFVTQILIFRIVKVLLLTCVLICGNIFVSQLLDCINESLFSPVYFKADITIRIQIYLDYG